ncbi:hypothetical protein D3C84_1046920 [compost metagenome]
MAAGMMSKIRYFASQPNIAEKMIGFQLQLDVTVQFLDRIDARGVSHTRHTPIPYAFLAAFSVFCISIVIVIGPTPPGTGVIAPAVSRQSS